ncbi:MAG: hypothetical protein KHX55_05130 [Proteobacteria bacterium]|nr:hypothetical protein [Pseudomonadota bacterium]
MKNKLLITTALVALVSASNAYADDIDRKEIIKNSKTLSETVEGLHSTKQNGGVCFIVTMEYI